MAGSVAAAGAAATTTSLAGTVQFTLSNNLVTESVNNLKADLTGDGIPDLENLFTWSNTGSYWSPGYYALSFYMNAFANGRLLGGVFARQRTFIYSSFSYTYATYRATAGTESNVGANLQTTRGFVPVTFTDNRVNYGAPTSGRLEVLAFNESLFQHTIRLVRLVFDDANTAAPANITPGGFNPEFDPNVYAIREAQAAAARSAAAAARQAEFGALSKKLRRLRVQQRKARRGGDTRKLLRITRQISKFRRQQRALIV